MYLCVRIREKDAYQVTKTCLPLLIGGKLLQTFHAVMGLDDDLCFFWETFS